jgi:rod shape-determining protein MreD
MINSIIRYTVIFIVLLLLQVLLFNNIQFSGYINPYIYVMFILLLPVEIPSWLLMIICFFTGLTVDFYNGTPGVHTSATVFSGFIRPYLLRLTSPRDGYEAGAIPSMAVYGFRWFLFYSGVMVLSHHIFLFYMEVFRFTDFFSTLLRVLLSTVFSVIFILLIEYYRRGR